MKILVIDSHAEYLDSLYQELATVADTDYELRQSENLVDGLKQLDTEIFDVVLVNINLPDADGAESFERISHCHTELPIIILTTQDDVDFAKRIVKTGAQDYLIIGEGDGLLLSRAIHYAIEKKKVEIGLSFMSNHDILTELPNRENFKLQLDKAIVRANRSGRKAVVVFIGLDRFKQINDSFGHAVGDDLLHQIGVRLEQSTRDTDTVARFGSDEFLVLLENVNEINDAVIVAKKLMHKVCEPLFHGETDIYVTPSLGISIFPTDSKSTDELISHADSAMTLAKEKGRNRIEFFTKEISTQSTEKLELESKLRRARDNNEFQLHYQPKFSIKTKRLIGAEALIRWNQPQLGMVRPDKFISIAEESGLITSIGEWVIQEAARQLNEWQSEGLRLVRIAINLSPKQFHEGDIAETLMSILSENGIQPRNIEVEITENMLVEDVEKTAQTLQRLKMWGIHIAIDDFGTGYSSLRYLKRLPIDTLKIDQSFVRDVISDVDDAAIASAIIALAHKLRMNVIAEGIETQEQLDFLDAQGCDEGQGYYYSKPLPAAEFHELLKNNQIDVSYEEFSQFKKTA